MKKRERLIRLYARMAEHTLPECRGTCRVPLSCCDRMYCEMTIEFARERWGVELARTNHATLPLMGEGGCTAAPHLRPLCTVHTCQVNSFGFKPDDPAWNKEYFKLRTSIENLEGELGKVSLQQEETGRA